MGAGSDEASANSTTASGISAGELEIRNEQAQQARTGQTAQEAIAQLNREVDSEQNGSQRLEPIFDKDKVRADIHAQIAITAEFGKAAAKGIGQYASQKQTQAQYKALLAQQSPDGELEGKTAQQWQQEADNWAEGGLWRTALHTAAGAMSGDLPGALGAAAASTAAPWLEKLQDNLQQQLAQSGMDSGSAREIAQTGTGLLATALGAAAGATAGAAAALNTDFNNRALHPKATDALKELRKGKTEEEQHRLVAAACALRNCADGVPKNDPYYQLLQELQAEGRQYKKEQEQLKATGQFEKYGDWDSTVDWYDRNASSIDKARGIGNVGQAGFTLAGLPVAAYFTCTGSGGALCEMAIAGTFIGAKNAVDTGAKGISQLAGTYQHGLGAQVLASFETPVDGYSNLTQDAIQTGLSLAGIYLGYKIGKAPTAKAPTSAKGTNTAGSGNAKVGQAANASAGNKPQTPAASGGSAKPVNSPETPQQIFSSRNAVLENVTSRNTSIQSIPNGTEEMALQDFNRMGLTDLKVIATPKGEVKMGKLPDGSTVKLRPSKDGGLSRPTIEVSGRNGRVTHEVRYGNRN